jgi:uncharacterized membrane protein YhaH (DUF805 family)
MADNLFQPMHLLVILFIVALIVPWIQIFRKAGYSGWLSILFLVPLANIIILFWFAFSKWPLQKEVEKLRVSSGAPIVP